MFDALFARLQQGHQTIGFPRQEAQIPDRFRGRPTINRDACPSDCRECVEACPTDAIQLNDREALVDLGRCIFCSDCKNVCPHGAVEYQQDYRLTTRRREDLVVSGEEELVLARALDEKCRRLFGHSLRLRQVSAGGCNACEADVNVLGTITYDLGRFGVQFVASPRHADGLLITGPVTRNMRFALEETYAAVPAPKIVIAVGACAISGGMFAGHEETHDGATSVLPVDLFIPGCPPHPITILDGLLRLLGRREE